MSNHRHKKQCAFQKKLICVFRNADSVEQSLNRIAREGDTGQAQRIEIARAYEAALGGKIQNGLMRIFHDAMALHYVGSCQYIPTKRNESGFLCYLDAAIQPIDSFVCNPMIFNVDSL